MRNRLFFSGLLLAVGFVLLNFRIGKVRLQVGNEKLSFPYRSQGLTRRQAAAHLLSRFTYGATPGQVDEVVSMGLEKWFLKQLDGNLPDDALNEKLSHYQYLNLTNSQIEQRFPKTARVLKMAIDDGVISRDSVGVMDKQVQRSILKEYMSSKNIHEQGELLREFINQRILRARYSENQLREVLTGFWFNHFNVSLTKPQELQLILSYERDVIRPRVTGTFRDLLQATAESPAMLLYLDNFISSKEMDSTQQQRLQRGIEKMEAKNSMYNNSADNERINRLKKQFGNKGLNENYARELMELHTMGVDGGYNQSDVTEAARVLTGWTIYPFGEGYSAGIRKVLEKIGEDKLEENGFVHKGDFLFASNKHDMGEKHILGADFPAGHGYDEGERLLQMLAHHPSTARFISKKLATYFVSDHPSSGLIENMAKTIQEKDGDIRAVLIAMVSSKEFWSSVSVRQKIKSPFEFVISASRALNSEVVAPYQLFLKMDKMGQKIYHYQAPTGFPDRADYWINSGSLLNRMNFGIDIASNTSKGTYTDLLNLNSNREPESAEAALRTYISIVLPERNMDSVVRRLLPLLTRPDVVPGINEAAGKHMLREGQSAAETGESNLMAADMQLTGDLGKRNSKEPSSNMLAQVVGLIIGSPEFQRR